MNRREVAAELSVSISPVNEAFAILQSEGIVQTLPRKGTFVSQLDWRDLVELTIVRTALEAEAARAYCGERIALKRKELLELAGRVDDAEPVTYEHLHADIVFHRTLVSLAGNRSLAMMLDTVIARSLLLAMEAALATRGRPTTMSHRKLVRDLCSAKPAAVDQIIRRNIYSGKEAFLDVDTARSVTDRPDTPLDLVLSVIQEAHQ
ncbi:MAG: GntR family transcriptional regulator [Spirochaetaceae bacterium]|nr:MAG: GntR family transcriptional regulator [Spirochaetaceae bacterium]